MPITNLELLYADQTDFHMGWTAPGPENFRTEVQLAGGDWSSLVGTENGLNVNNISTGEDTWDHGFGGLSVAIVYTDGWKSYDGLVLGGYKHHRIHHHQNQFARGRNYVNGNESFWSFTKLRVAKLRGVRAQYYFLHLKESEWRWNHRHENLYHSLLKNLRLRPL